MNGRYDVIIIGTGAGGGTLAHTLAPSGKRILLLEFHGYLNVESGGATVCGPSGGCAS